MAKVKNKKREDGRLQSKVYIGNVDGKAKYKYVYAKTQKELEKKILEVKISLGKGINISAQNDTFGEWLEQWLRLKKVEISDKKYKSYLYKKSYLKNILNIPVSKIRTQDLQNIILDNMHLSEYTLNQIKGMCSQIIQLAIDNRVLDYNPAKAVKIPRLNNNIKNLRRALTEEEQQWIINTPHKAQLPAMIMMFAGLRRGEVIPLLWSDIDLNNGTIQVNKSVENINGVLKIKNSLKSEAGKRIVYIPDILINYLKPLKPSKGNELVCTSAKGIMLTDDSWRSMWDSYLTELNLKYGDFSNYKDFNVPKSKFAPVKIPFVIPRFTAHWLRHTFITMLYMAGIDVLTAKEQAGHSDIKTTMSIYTHLDNKYKAKTMNKLNDYLNGCQTGVSDV